MEEPLLPAFLILGILRKYEKWEYKIETSFSTRMSGGYSNPSSVIV